MDGLVDSALHITWQMNTIRVLWHLDCLSTLTSLDCLSTLLNLISPKVTVEMNNRLTKTFTEEEISDALFQIGPLKAPGADGFPARFYQRDWGTMKEDVISAVKDFFCIRHHA